MVKSILTNKKAQAWGLDLLVASIIFVISIVVIYFYAINYVSSSSESLRGLFFEAEIASNILLSSEENGILTDWKIDKTKLEIFDSLPENEKKAVLGLSKNFYFYVEGMHIGGALNEYVGILNSTETESQIQIVRLCIYENKPIKFRVIAWE